MNQKILFTKKPGRPAGSRNKETLLKARADAALGQLEILMSNPAVAPEVRIEASLVVWNHYQQHPKTL